MIQAAIRELKEEAVITVQEKDVSKVGRLTFDIEDYPVIMVREKERLSEFL